MPLTIIIISLLFLQTHLSISNGVSQSTPKSTEIDKMVTRVCSKNDCFALESSEIDKMVKRVCSKNDCFAQEDEMVMDSEINRRVLMMQRKYISYETLKKNIVPCERPGASYYNCRAGGVANPYTRGCEIITGCARDVNDIKS